MRSEAESPPAWRSSARWAALALIPAAAAALFLSRERLERDLLATSAAEPFNVVILLVDALRADRLPFYGHSKPTAPFLSQLAAEGAVFERAHAASTWTPSSVASLFTGLYPNQHQVWTGFVMARSAQASDRPLLLNRIPEEAPTLAERMRERGYRTFGVSSNANFGEEMGFRRGFERFAHPQRKSGDAVNESVREWLPELRRAQRYFLYLHYMDTHKPYHTREPWSDASAPDPDLARYDSAIGYVDTQIEELYRALGWQERTLLILLADHGEEFGDHGGSGHGNQVYNELMRVPLVFWWPGVIGPRRIQDNVSNVDVLPTLEELLGGAAPRTPVAGESLAPLLEGRPMPARTLFAMRRAELDELQRERMAAIRDSWKYILSLPEQQEELYDTHRDPGEKHDLIARSPEVAARLRKDLERFQTEAPRHARAYVESERSASELADSLRPLGYVQ